MIFSEEIEIDPRIIGGGRVNNRAALARRGKNWTIKTSKAYQLAKQTLIDELTPRWSGDPIESPRVTIWIHWARTIRKGPAAGKAMIDVDSLIKVILDALTASKIIWDDSDIEDLIVRKRTTNRPRIYLRIESKKDS